MNYKKRARKLVKKMTLNEKVGQLAQDFWGFNAYERDENNNIVLTEEFKSYVLKFGGLGMINNYFRSDPWCKKNYITGGITLKERETAYNLLQEFIIENTRLGIPVLIEEDAPHGRQVLDSILYPVSFNIGCSFNPELYKEQTKQIGTEAKLGGVNVPYLSILDVSVDPRWGRTEECFSEDPYLSSVLSAAAVEGMNESGNMVCAKHFAAQGAAVGGHNAGVAVIGERELREIHFPSTRSAVKAGCDFIMAAYNEIDGLPCHANRYLLNDILRDEFGFDGVVRSDGCAVDRMGEAIGIDLAETAALAVKSGVDCGLWDTAMTKLEESVEKGYISEEEIDIAVCRLLEKKFKVGLMDNPYIENIGQSEEYIKSGIGQKIAYMMATESLVLLENNGILPLKEGTKSLLIGGNTDNVYYMLGDYTSERKGTVSIREHFGKNGVHYLEGWNFEDGVTALPEELAAAAAEADVIFFGCGGSSVRDFESVYNDAGAIEKAAKFMDCGEGQDLASLELADCQKKLLKELKRLGKPIVSLIIAGRPYVLNDIKSMSDAVLFCGYAGEWAASAIYDTLFGKQNRFGRLSMSFPKHAGQLPICYHYKTIRPYIDFDEKPLYPFGYGLSYSSFEWSDYEIEEASSEDIILGKSIKVSLRVKNVSDIEGSEVVELYIHKNGGNISHRNKELRGFKKIHLAAGEEKRVEFTLSLSDLVDWSTEKKYELIARNVDILIGKSCENILKSYNVKLK